MTDADLQKLTKICPAYIPEAGTDSGVDGLVPDAFKSRVHDQVRFTCAAIDPATRCKAKVGLWRESESKTVLRFTLDVRCPADGAVAWSDQVLPLAMDPWQHVMPAADVRSLYHSGTGSDKKGPFWRISTELPPQDPGSYTDVIVSAEMTAGD